MRNVFLFFAFFTFGFDELLLQFQNPLKYPTCNRPIMQDRNKHGTEQCRKKHILETVLRCAVVAHRSTVTDAVIAAPAAAAAAAAAGVTKAADAVTQTYMSTK